MRARNFLQERSNPLTTLKTKVKNQIDLTDDESLLNRIYTSLNSGTLITRLSKGLDSLSDPEIHTFVNEIANAIVQSPGSYEEKTEFVKGLHKGFIDIGMMLDGNRHHFVDLLKPNDKVSKKFLFNMFNSLKDLGGKAKKGPGEFAIAIMSPVVSVFGGGDLKIGNKIVEVKAGSGTIGDTSMFQHQEVGTILQKYIPGMDVDKPIGATHLVNAAVNANLEPPVLKELSEELANYIFKGQQDWAKTGPLKTAIAQISAKDVEGSIKNIRNGYLQAAYSAYKHKKDKSNKFDGIMLINFDNQELRYFEDPEEMYNDVDTVTFSFAHPNPGWAGKLISPSVNLRRAPLEKPEVPEKGTTKSFKQYIERQAEYLVKRAQQRFPQNIDLRDPELLKDVTATIRNLADQGVPARKITTTIMSQFPILQLKKVEPAPVPAPAPATSKRKVTPSPAPAAI